MNFFQRVESKSFVHVQYLHPGSRNLRVMLSELEKLNPKISGRTDTFTGYHFFNFSSVEISLPEVLSGCEGKQRLEVVGGV
jgi:hypothetical protein